MFFICVINSRAPKSVSTHEETFYYLLSLPWELAPKYLTCLIYRGAFCGVEILLSGMKWLVHVQHAPGAKPLVCIGLNAFLQKGTTEGQYSPVQLEQVRLSKFLIIWYCFFDKRW